MSSGLPGWKQGVRTGNLLKKSPDLWKSNRMRRLFPFTSQCPAHLQISNGEAVTLMPRTVYLEAPAKSQHLLTTKWTLRSCGYVIASTWHEESRLASSGPQSHWA